MSRNLENHHTLSLPHLRRQISLLKQQAEGTHGTPEGELLWGLIVWLTLVQDNLTERYTVTLTGVEHDD